MLIRSDQFKLNPGVDVEGVGHIVGCRVRLLPKAVRETAQISVSRLADEQMRALITPGAVLPGQDAALAKNQDEREIDTAVKYAILMNAEGEVFFKLRIAAFISDSGVEITDQARIDSIVSLLYEPDEEEIRGQQQELQDAYRRPKFRPKHKCGNCGSVVECTREVTAPDATPSADVPRV